MTILMPFTLHTFAAPPERFTFTQTTGMTIQHGLTSCDRSSKNNKCNEIRSSDSHDSSSSRHSNDDDDARDSTNTEGQSERGSTSSEYVIGKQETKEVTRFKLVVFLVLAVSAVGVASTVYMNTKSYEESNFREAFRDDSEAVFRAIGTTLDNILGSFDSLAVSTVSMAQATNQTWPFVTLPNFAVQMSKVVPLSRTFAVFMAPVVTPAQRDRWEVYTLQHDSWVNESIDVQRDFPDFNGPLEYHSVRQGAIHGDFADIPRNSTRVLLPAWQNFPTVANTPYTYNWDWLSTSFPEAPLACLDQHQTVITAPYMIPTPGNKVEEAETAAWGDYFKGFIPPEENPIEPVSDLFYPIIDEINRVHVAGADDYDPSNHTIVGVIAASIYWRSILRDILPKDSIGIRLVVENACTESFTYQINGPNLFYAGVGDHHDEKYYNLGVHRKLDSLSEFEASGSVYSGAEIHKDYCPFQIHLYPSDEMKDKFSTNNPAIFTAAVIIIFCFSTLAFFFYDSKVERRQQTVLSNATRTSAIVSSLFPSEVRDQLFPLVEENPKRTFRTALNDRLQDGDSHDAIEGSVTTSPIASLYPETTVLFADIVGFTAWSSVRQPAQVFLLLESVYAAFDELAKQRGVFKVETIGDSYVAVVGLPTQRKNHAVVMARFASDCRSQMREVVMELEQTLGPGTADLSMRFGLNSGPTTGGVLRGDKARFQLFGDTVNTAARMESNGERDRIQVSSKTADLIRLAGKGHWLIARADKVNCKGKGLMTTYWCGPRSKSGSIVASDTSNSDMYLLPNIETIVTPDIQQQRLIDWNVDFFSGILKEVLNYRRATGSKPANSKILYFAPTGPHPLDEVSDVLSMPTTSCAVAAARGDCEISPQVLSQLTKLIASIGKLYRDNAFHNFEHASHVTTSTKKLLDRIQENSSSCCNDAPVFSIDPLTKFAIVFAALIHDVDHPGVSNAQLVQEQSLMAVTYNGNSVAEQNSVDVAWNVLMQGHYSELREVLLGSDVEMKRFRSVMINVVMATDLFDPDLQNMREARWRTSFCTGSSSKETATTPPQRDQGNRRATIIIDLIIQASDVSHTMQHFTVYQKWNLRLLKEMYEAYQSGRSVNNPLDGWYEGELWFFDNYIIPLAEKLRVCGVFGVSCDEFLDYAKDNRMEWEARGHALVQEVADSLRCAAPLAKVEGPFEI